MNNFSPVTPQTPKIAILTALGGQWGSGHYQRSVAICMLWDPHVVTRYVLCPVDLISSDKSDFGEELRDFQLHRLVLRIVEEKTQILLIDRREFAQRWVSFLEQSCNIRCVLFDSVGPERNTASLLIDAIPSLQQNLPSNLLGWEYLPAPSLSPVEKLGVLIFFGFVDDAKLTHAALRNLQTLCDLIFNKDNGPIPVTVYIGGGNSSSYFAKIQRAAKILDGEKFLCEVLWQNSQFLKKLNACQLLLCHFGISCFQAIGVKTPFLLLAPTRYHQMLSDKHFAELTCSLRGGELALPATITSYQTLSDSFASATKGISVGGKFPMIRSAVDALGNQKNLNQCRVCNSVRTSIMYRKIYANFYFCSACKNFSLKELFPIELVDPSSKITYDQDYFLEEYRLTYGKTYQEDKPTISLHSASRLQKIIKYKSSGKLLDIGCALGYFLDLAKQRGFQTYGVEISQYAAEIAQRQHTIFQNDFLQHSFSQAFDVISLWYVIEHFPAPAEVFKKIYSIQKKGGILAISTPNAIGISAKGNATQFFQRSPNDHYVVFSPYSLRKLCKKYGYSLLQIHNTGIHLDRFKEYFPTAFKYTPKKIIPALANFLHWGDTFEIYLQKL